MSAPKSGISRGLEIDPGSMAHRVLLTLRPGSPTEQSQLSARCGSIGATLVHLDRAGLIERTADGRTNGCAAYWRITAAGREACPPRRGAFADYHDFSTKTLGDLS